MYKAYINKHWPGNVIILASYRSTAREVPLSTVHRKCFASCLTTMSLIPFLLIWAQIKALSSDSELLMPLSCPCSCLLLLHTHLEQSTESAIKLMVQLTLLPATLKCENCRQKWIILQCSVLYSFNKENWH